MSLTHTLKRAVESPVRRVSDLLNSLRGNYHGVYASYDEAMRSIPGHVRAGYNHAVGGEMYRGQMTGVRASDYPALYWLARLLPAARRVFDYGGNVGVTYYRFRPYLDYPAGLEWHVCDLPEVTRIGEQVSAERREQAVRFTNRFADCDGADILMGFGAIQYIPEPLGPSLAALPRKPAAILLNRIPLCDGPAFVTVDYTGPLAAPYQVFSREPFLRSLEEAGYELADEWLTWDLPCRIPWHPERSSAAQSGLYLKLR